MAFNSIKTVNKFGGFIEELKENKNKQYTEKFNADDIKRINDIASKPFDNGFVLKVQVDNNYKNDLLFKFDEAKDMIDFVRIFRKTCNTVCEYSVGIEETDD